jgi:acetylornithine deacetylase/succinyl-diaminopimelate desuccinylase-like protein
VTAEPVDIVALTRSLVDIDSTTGREGECGRWLADYLRGRGWPVEEQRVDNTRFNEGHRLTDGVEVTLLSTPCSVSRVDDKIQANAAESITLANVSLGAMGFSLLSINWQVIR